MFNVHLDPRVTLSQEEGLKSISSIVKEKSIKYGNKLKNYFVFGDFNIVDTDSIFKLLENFKSVRHVLPKEQSDLEPTYNGFNNILAFLGNIFMKRKVTLDHIFIKLSNIVPKKFSVLRDDFASDHHAIIG